MSTENIDRLKSLEWEYNNTKLSDLETDGRVPTLLEFFDSRGVIAN